jgi:hypothetical protein
MRLGNEVRLRDGKSTTFEIGLLVPGLIAPLDPKAEIGATMPPAGAGNVRCPAHFRRSANNRYPPN